MTDHHMKARNRNVSWSGAELFELRSSVARGDLVEETAALLKRCKAEVQEKIDELRLNDAGGPQGAAPTSRRLYEATGY